MAEAKRRGHHESVLVIDDDEVFRSYLACFLEESGYVPVQAKDGGQGLRLFHEQEPSAVLVDLRMPGMDGLDVLAAIVERAPHVPVILVSGEGELEDAIKAMHLGAWDYVVKSPEATDTLAQVLDKALNESYELLNRNLYQEAMDEEVRESRRKIVEFRKRLQAEKKRSERRQTELEKERGQVEDMSVTLKTVIRTFEKDKRDYMREVVRQVEEQVMPEVERMAREHDPEMRRSRKDVIAEHLSSIAEGETGMPDQEMVRLTPTELDVCDYVRAGRTTGEIADLMHSSLDTIQTHRKNIRKKLGLVGSKVSLYTYLRSRRQHTE